MAQTNGSITAAVLIEYLLFAHISQSRLKPAINGEAVLQGVFLSLLESSTDGKSILNNTRHPLFPSETITLHILHIPSVPSASNSFLYTPGRKHPLASLNIFQRSEGLAQVAMRCRYSLREALPAPSVQCRLLFVVVLSAV
jgi:hypothetical protein